MISCLPGFGCFVFVCLCSIRFGCLCVCVVSGAAAWWFVFGIMLFVVCVMSILVSAVCFVCFGVPGFGDLV